MRKKDMVRLFITQPYNNHVQIAYVKYLQPRYQKKCDVIQIQQ